MLLSDCLLRAVLFAGCASALLLACGGGGGSGSMTPAPPANVPPSVNAGPDQRVSAGEQVLLAGAVSDPDDEPLLQWTQTAGAAVDLSDPGDPAPEFTAPMVAAETPLEFRLEADDGNNPPVADHVQITVLPAAVEVTRLNPEGQSYIDPEIHPLRGELVFQSDGEVWVGAINLDTGRFFTLTGKDHYVDDTVSLSLSRNGPEYGLDSDGVAIFYNVLGADGRAQFSRAAEQGTGDYAITVLTGGAIERINQLPSQDATSPTTYLVYARDGDVPGSVAATGYIAFLDEAVPTLDIDVTELRQGLAGFRWLRGSTLFTTTIAEEGPEQGQVLLVDAATGDTRVVTDDPGVKFDPYAWYAPEYGGVIAVQATVNQTDIAVYVDRGSEPFERVALLTPPPDTELRYVQSAEPFVSREGISYISLTLKDNPGSVFGDVNESEIWIYGIGAGTQRFSLDCGDGVAGKVRHEAEMVSGEDQILVYYNELRPTGQFDLVVCASGLPP